MKNVSSQSFRKLTVLVTGFALSLMLIPGALAQGRQNFTSAASQSRLDFTLHNETGLEINEVYLSPTETEDWEEDVLGQDTLGSGESVDITFTRRPEKLWDLKVVFSNGRSSFWRKFNLSQITDITISFRGGKPWATWKNGG